MFASDCPFDPEKGTYYIRETLKILDGLEPAEGQVQGDHARQSGEAHRQETGEVTEPVWVCFTTARPAQRAGRRGGDHVSAPAFRACRSCWGTALPNDDPDAIAIRRDLKNINAAARNVSHLAGLLGPGLVTGAADDDPAGIATYSQAGAQFGFGLLWRSS